METHRKDNLSGEEIKIVDSFRKSNIEYGSIRIEFQAGKIFRIVKEESVKV
jgi:hypothetical protein